MSILSRRQKNKIDRFFFETEKLQEEVISIAAERAAKAEESADPTARQAVEHLAPVPHAFGYDDPELWLQAAKETWDKYGSTQIGEVMRRRYVLNENWIQTTFQCFISDGCYFKYLDEFILYCALMLAKKGIDLELDDGKMLSEWSKYEAQ